MSKTVTLNLTNQEKQRSELLLKGMFEKLTVSFNSPALRKLMQASKSIPNNILTLYLIDADLNIDYALNGSQMAPMMEYLDNVRSFIKSDRKSSLAKRTISDEALDLDVFYGFSYVEESEKKDPIIKYNLSLFDDFSCKSIKIECFYDSKAKMFSFITHVNFDVAHTHGTIPVYFETTVCEVKKYVPGFELVLV